MGEVSLGDLWEREVLKSRVEGAEVWVGCGVGRFWEVEERVVKARWWERTSASRRARSWISIVSIRYLVVHVRRSGDVHLSCCLTRRCCDACTRRADRRCRGGVAEGVRTW